MYKDLDKFRKELKQWRKERLISICKEYEVEQNEEQLKAITNREIIDLIISKQEKINLEINDLEQPLLQIEEEDPLNNLLGMEFIRTDDDLNNNPTIFKCINVNKNSLKFRFDENKTLEVKIDELDTLLKPINAADKVNKKEQEIKIEKVKTEEIKVAEVKKDKENNSIKKEKKEKKPKERLIGPGRGRKTAKILCFETPDRKNPIQEFTTFADARYFLGVKSVGTSLEKASETGKPSHGYWWTVIEMDISSEDIKPKKENATKTKKNVASDVEDVLITPPVLAVESKGTEEPLIYMPQHKGKAKKKEEPDEDEDNIFQDIFEQDDLFGIN